MPLRLAAFWGPQPIIIIIIIIIISIIIHINIIIVIIIIIIPPRETYRAQGTRIQITGYVPVPIAGTPPLVQADFYLHCRNAAFG